MKAAGAAWIVGLTDRGTSPRKARGLQAFPKKHTNFFRISHCALLLIMV